MFRVIFHLDMDAFYASVEQRDNPALRGRPVIVGAPADQRGVVCAASYEARKFGVRSAMPSVTARRLCPRGVFIPPRMECYRQESERIMQIILETGALVEQVSIDEAYLDLSSICARNGDSSLYSAVPAARALKKRIFEDRKLTASIGIGANKMISKLASDYSKPDGLTLIPERDKVLFLRPMPVRVIHGVGKVTERVLYQAGIQSIGDLQDYPGDLRRLAGSFAPALKAFAFGEDDRPLETNGEVKSISSENTFARDTNNRQILRDCLREQAREIAARLMERRLGAKTVQIKVRYGDFTTLTRQITVEELLSSAPEIYRFGCYLIGREKLASRPLRLLGLGVSGLGESREQQLTFSLK